jgi:hypothetical protein
MATFLESEIARLKVDIGVTKDDIAAFQERLQDPNLTPLQRGTAQRNLDRAQARLVTQQEELAKAEAAQAQKAAGPPPQPAPPATAAQTVQDDAPKGPNATPSQEVGTDGRVTTRPETAPATNADKPPVEQPGSPGETTGTDAPVKTGEQTQAVNTDSNSGQAVKEPPPPAVSTEETTKDETEVAPPSAPIQAGQSAKDDGTTKNTTNTQAAVNATEPATFKVITQPNVLDQFASYTYSASVYLLTAAQYKRLLRTKSRRIDGYQLLFQSGGAPANKFGERAQSPAPATPGNNSGDDEELPQQTGPEDGRSPFFPNDFYIDSITLNTVLMGKGSGSSHQTSDLKFTVVEPNGITLLDCLKQAVYNATPKGFDNNVNYTAAQYLMVIRFHGYDESGNLVSPIKGSITDRGGNRTDPTAVVEKFIPFGIKNLNWSIGSKMVTYEWDCAPINILVGGYTARGTIPYDVQLVDSTVGGLLGGDVVFASTAGNNVAGPGGRGRNANVTAATQARTGVNLTNSNAGGGRGSANDPRRSDAPTAQAPAKANAAPPATGANKISQGLCEAMNKFQADLVRRGIYTYPDNYSIRFEDGVDGTPGTAISGAKMQLPNAIVDKSKTSMQEGAAQAGGKALNPATNAVDSISRNFSITAGMQMLQAIDLVVRNSSYIASQSLVTLNADGSYEPNPENKNKKMKWFTVTMEAEPTGVQDPLRNDFAYNITYVVRPYVLQNFLSRYFPRSDFGGVHKSYPFWFTGENIAVIDYQESMNTLYQITVNGSDPKNNAATQIRDEHTSDASEILRYTYSPRSTESSSGADGKEFEANANAAEVLYSPGDIAESKVKIVGDPAWISQGEEYVDLSDPKERQIIQESGFQADGSISFNTSDVMFEMVWQRPQDYDIATGLADPFSKSVVQGTRKGIQSRIYKSVSCLSEFRQGRFEQTLTGQLFQFKVPARTTAANAAGKKDADSADTKRPATAGNEKSKGRSSGLTDKQAQQARADFAARDPRRSDSSDGGKAAILGAQGAYKQAQFAENAGGAAFGNPSITRQGVTAGSTGTSALTTAGSPQPASSGSNSGAVIPVAENVSSAPPKMPAAGPGQNTLTPEQRRQVARAGDDAARAYLAQREAKNEQRLAASGSPVSSSIPSNQKIAKDY